MKLKKVFSSETIVPISTKLCWDEPWVVPFENCVRQCRPVSRMAAMTKNRNFFKWPKLLYFKVESSQIWTFAYFDRLCKLEQMGDEIKKKSSPLKLQSQSQLNFAEMILVWSPFKFVSVSAVLYPRWPPWLIIEISSNGQNCSILSQKVPKFELYKHNDELFSIYYGIFYELWTFAYFDRLCKLEKRGDEIKKKIFSSETTEPISTKLCWNDSWVVPFQNCVRQRRPVSKMATITRNINFFQWPKLLYFKPESAQIWTV